VRSNCASLTIKFNPLSPENSAINVILSDIWAVTVPFHGDKWNVDDLIKFYNENYKQREVNNWEKKALDTEM
jgi:hypothetical protein